MNPGMEAIARSGWMRLPPLDARVVAEVRDVVARVDEALSRHARSSEVGLVQLSDAADLDLKREANAALATLLAMHLTRAVPAHRAVLFNVIVKRARSPKSAVPLHRDFALVDERAGAAALQVWIPLVDVDAQDGALVVVEGSQLNAPPIRTLASTSTSIDADSSRTVRPALRAGEGLVFVNGTVHASTANESAHDRPAVAAILVPNGVSMVHWIDRPPRHAELWSIPDDEYVALSPERLPPGAKLLEVVEVTRAV
jgi:ectoine hydroxylase-related dioxygenase (phytanoyl-CoA dioxygenase family)